jgi:predicted NBD/HSP70 family sugar kinase
MNKPVAPKRDVFDAERRGLTNLTVRRANEKTVLTVVAINRGVSNADISRLSGLAPQTVSAILVDLEEEGLIQRAPVLRGRRGQPATPILLSPDGGLSIGVEIGWRHMDLVLVNMHAAVERHYHLDYDYPDAETVVDIISAVVADFAAGLTPEQRARLLDLGLAMPGDLATNLDILGAPPEQLDLWMALDLVAKLKAKTGLEVSQFNDGNAGCWAELVALQSPRPDNVIYILVSHFIASGVIVDGRLWEGATGNAAELGALLVSAGGDGPVPADQIASIAVLRERLDMAGHASWGLPAVALDHAPLAGEIEKWLGEAARAVAQVIFNANRMVEEPLVVIDTVLARETTARLVERVESELTKLPTRWTHPRIETGKLGTQAPAIGAAQLTLYRRYF